jgi:hypothetical protein
LKKYGPKSPLNELHLSEDVSPIPAMPLTKQALSSGLKAIQAKVGYKGIPLTIDQMTTAICLESKRDRSI